MKAGHTLIGHKPKVGQKVPQTQRTASMEPGGVGSKVAFDAAAALKTLSALRSNVLGVKR